MALADFLAELERIRSEAESAFAAVGDADALEAARVEFLGARQGRLKSARQGMASVGKEDKPAAGKGFNQTKQALDAAFDDARQRLERTASAAGQAEAGQFDPTLPGVRRRLGRIHPITQTIEELKDLMGRLGFNVTEGPEVEDDRHNFEALNIPPAHPARDPLDNFYLAAANAQGATGGLSTRAETDPADKALPGKPAVAPAGTGAEQDAPMLLRSQTSTVQIRVMERTRPPVRIVSLGRVYRPDTPDATHYPMFHQVEGLYVDRGVTMADLKTVLRLFATSYLGHDVHIRFRPSFFPFTEPSVEADFQWDDKWVEFGGAGMVDPNVLTAVGYDPEEVTGFAFGLGVERLCARRHGVTDIREFYKNDVRFLEQF